MLQAGDLSQPDGPDPVPSDIFRILVATDLHLGAFEKQRHRGIDTFVTFEEILQRARTENVDFLLLTGDIFHENKPSHTTLYRTIELLRQYCLGDKEISFQLVSPPASHFSGRFACANYEDPNLNVALPVFCIHGNHDDPTGPNQLSALDLLAACGLINYFGKVPDYSRVEVSPLLLRKGRTRLALYGLGFIPDERLNRLFNDRKVTFLRPRDAPTDWFNIFCIHQNRHVRGLTGVDRARSNAVTDEMLRGFFDLVIWGHEHECVKETVVVQQTEREGAFEILQPGSSVVTSLSPEEAKPKHCVLLEVHQTRYKLTWHRLQTVRSFMIEDVSLAEESLEKTTEDVRGFLTEKVETMLQIGRERAPIPPEVLACNPSLALPLVRLRVDYAGGFPTINPQQFGTLFMDRVANPTEILHQLKRPQHRDAATTAKPQPYQSARTQEEAAVTIDDLVMQFLRLNELDILEEAPLTEAVKDYVDKAEASAIGDAVQHTVKEVQREVWRFSKAISGEFGREQVYDKVKDIKRVKKQHMDTSDAKAESPRPPGDEALDVFPADQGVRRPIEDMEINDNDPAATAPGPVPKRRAAGQGRGRGAGARGSTARGRPSGGRGVVPRLLTLKEEDPSPRRREEDLCDVDREDGAASPPPPKRPKAAPSDAAVSSSSTARGGLGGLFQKWRG